MKRRDIPGNTRARGPSEDRFATRLRPPQSRENASPWSTPEEDEEDRFGSLPGDTFSRITDPRSFR